MGSRESLGFLHSCPAAPSPCGVSQSEELLSWHSTAGVALLPELLGNTSP